MDEIIIRYGEKAKAKDIKWTEAAVQMSLETGTNITAANLRARYYYILKNKMGDKQEVNNKEEIIAHPDGSLTFNRKMFFDKNEDKSPANVLKKLGYSIDEWDIITVTFGTWEVAIKEEASNRVCTTVRVKIKPKVLGLSLEHTLKAVEESMKHVIKPLNLPKKEKTVGLDKNKMMEFPSPELHFGKLGWHGDCGQNFDHKIAQKRFETIIAGVVEKQDMEQAGTLYHTIGNDFFNSDNKEDTTTKGTQQHSDVRYQKMFIKGLDMYKSALVELKKHFNTIDVLLCPGNHDNQMSFHLFIALKLFFEGDDVIHIRDNLKETQCYTFGDCMIVTNHGNTNTKRLMKSVLSEFSKEWGKAKFRELHAHHLHSEYVVDEDWGLIFRRVSSVSGLDTWHYNQRFVNSVQKQQIFMWDAKMGNMGTYNIPFTYKDGMKKVKKCTK